MSQVRNISDADFASFSDFALGEANGVDPEYVRRERVYREARDAPPGDPDEPDRKSPIWRIPLIVLFGHPVERLAEKYRCGKAVIEAVRAARLNGDGWGWWF